MVSFKLSIGKTGIAGSDMFCNEAIIFFKHDDNITNKYLYYFFSLTNFSQGNVNGDIGNGSLNKKILYDTLIPNIPLPTNKK